MKPSRNVGLVGLILGALLILLEHPGWTRSAAESLAVAVAFLLYAGLGRPWNWRAAPARCPGWPVALGAFSAVGGLLLASTGLFALAWALFLMAFLEVHVESAPRRLVLLPFLGFPWIAADLQPVEWGLRLSGAAVIDWVFFALGMIVERHGVCLTIEGKPLAIDACCSGLDTLPAMMIAGFVLAFLYVPAGGRFFWAMACLAPLAWLVNSLRFLVMATLTLTYGANIASGWSRYWGGWLAICLMLILSRALFPWIATVRLSRDQPVRWE